MDILIISEVENKYKNEWLLFEVTDCDELNQPIKGRLLLHTKSRDLLEKKLVELDVPCTYHIYTGDPIPEGCSVVL